MSIIENSATIGFIISHACPLKCDFCCHDRGTIGARRIDRATMRTSLLQFCAEPTVTRFAFSGGDPFLYFDDIVEVVASARSAGVVQPFHLVTSGYWADGATTEARLARLRALGMDRLNVSYDVEHARWVTPDQIREVARAARALGIHVELYASFWNREDDIRALLPDVDQLADEVNVYAVARSGRAARSGRRTTMAVPLQSKFSCGAPSHYSMAVYPDGEVYPCCAGDFNSAARLSCGNIRTHRPADILANAYRNFHVRMAKELGWGALYALIERDHPELVAQLPRFEDVDTPCEICRELNTRLKDALRPIYDVIEREYARTMAEHEWRARDAARPDQAQWRFGGQCGTRDWLIDRLASDRSARERYIAGLETIEAA